ncbi:hypothetical protein EWM64_g2965 [Hericium alpestre]|uniref:Cytochrome P450 n=1 Tax=Hericium alpestre TaxID=135208 RepID=A0A4Z0A1W1_9AGAM|nr:hypothetical protein EWM64_g2965 [Hericium alpestre]
MEIAYGHDIAPKNDRFVELAEKSVDMLSEATGAASVLNVFPLLLRLPSWMPGMGFKVLAKKCTAMTSEMLEVPWSTVKHQMAEGTARPSLASTWIARNKESGAGEEADHIARDAAAVLYAAGADTGVATMTTGLLAPLTNPDVQRRAQDEIDSVIARISLPTFEDRAKLPYVGAVVREVLRWHYAVPLSVMREAGMDDVYDEMFIPKDGYL